METFTCNGVESRLCQPGSSTDRERDVSSHERGQGQADSVNSSADSGLMHLEEVGNHILECARG